MILVKIIVFVETYDAIDLLIAFCYQYTCIAQVVDLYFYRKDFLNNNRTRMKGT